MTTLMRVQSAAQVASRHVGGPARAALMAFIDALEVEIEGEESAHKLGEAERAQPKGDNNGR